MTLISVIIPTYNRSALLREAVESVLAQTYSPVEIIVVDDGSTDDTAEVMAGYGDRVRYVRQENTGVSAARNRGFRVSQGDLICFLDDDDLYDPRKIERQVSEMQTHPEVGLVHCRYLLANAVGRVVGRIGLLPEGNILEVLLMGNFLWMSAPLIRRDVLEQVGGFDEQLSTAADYDMWVRIAKAGHAFGCSQELLGTYRLQQGSMVTNVARTEREVITVLDQFFANPDLPANLQGVKNRAYALWRLWFARRYYALEDWAEASRNLSEAMSLDLTLQPATIIENLYSEALDERVNDPFQYVKGVFDHLPPTAESLLSYRDDLIRRIHLALTLRSYQHDDTANTQKQFVDTLQLYPDIPQMEQDFIRITVENALSLSVDINDYLRRIFTNLPHEAAILAKQESRVRGDINIARAFEDYHNDSRESAVTLVLRGIYNQPAWILHRGVLSMLVKSLPTWLKQFLFSTL